MIKVFNNFMSDDSITFSKYPQIRHLSSYESAISILKNGYFLSRCELKKDLNNIDSAIIETKKFNSKDKWWDERSILELKRFGTENLIYCIPDWFDDGGYETGHGPVMFYFKPSIFEDFKVTLTIEDSLTEIGNKIYDTNEIKKIYYDIINNKSQTEAKRILENLKSKNIESYFNTSRGKLFIEGGRFYNRYAEFQIHAKKISISYIQNVKFTDNYLGEKKSDKELKEKFILIYNKYDNKL
jgi:hypothetical protein